jgi:hypothetical protein
VVRSYHPQAEVSAQIWRSHQVVIFCYLLKIKICHQGKEKRKIEVKKRGSRKEERKIEKKKRKETAGRRRKRKSVVLRAYCSKFFINQFN